MERKYMNIEKTYRKEPELTT